eukprot:6191176-Pleurochrysis_carterae.AAC.1
MSKAQKCDTGVRCLSICSGRPDCARSHAFYRPSSCSSLGCIRVLTACRFRRLRAVLRSEQSSVHVKRSCKSWCNVRRAKMLWRSTSEINNMNLSYLAIFSLAVLEQRVATSP